MEHASDDGHENEVSLMVLRREGGRMVAKLELDDPNVRDRFQRLLDLTHRPRGNVVQCETEGGHGNDVTKMDINDKIESICMRMYTVCI